MVASDIRNLPLVCTCPIHLHLYNIAHSWLQEKVLEGGVAPEEAVVGEEDQALVGDAEVSRSGHRMLQAMLISVKVCTNSLMSSRI